jgi:hypothetical protein
LLRRLEARLSRQFSALPNARLRCVPESRHDSFHSGGAAMAFVITGRIVEPDGCRIPHHRLNAIDVASGRVLASTEVEERPESEFRLEYDRTAIGQPDEPHEVLLVASDQELQDARAAAVVAREGQSVGIEARIAVADWEREGDVLVAKPVIRIDCCCILWALKGVYTVTGTLRDATTGLPLPGATVEAQDWDPIAPDFLGSDVTDAAGRFTILVPFANFVNEDAPTYRPDLRFQVTSPLGGGKEQHCLCLRFADDVIRFDWPNCKHVDLRVDCCLAIILTVGSWSAGLAAAPTLVTHPPFPTGRGIDSAAARAQGLNAIGSSGPAEDSPFGGLVDLCGAHTCRHAARYRWSVARWTDEATAPGAGDFNPILTTFSEVVWDGFTLECPSGPMSCYLVPHWSTVSQSPDGEGFYPALHNSASGCEFHLPWYTGAPAYPDGKYTVVLTLEEDDGCRFNSGPVTIRLDNTLPVRDLKVSVEDCAHIKIGTVVTGTLTCTDENFHSYQLVYEGDSTSGVIAEREYTGVGDTGDVDVPWSWDTSGLPKCGYRLVLRVWDRTIYYDVRPEGEPGFRQGVPIVKYYCLD